MLTRSSRLLTCYCRRMRVRWNTGPKSKAWHIGYAYSRALRWEARNIID